jgi:hypothetical protein
MPVEDPIVLTYVAELAATGSVSTGVFQMLFDGKTAHVGLSTACANAEAARRKRTAADLITGIG